MGADANRASRDRGAVSAHEHVGRLSRRPSDVPLGRLGSPLSTHCGHYAFRGQRPDNRRERFTMGVTRIVANLTAPDPMGLAKFYEEVFELDLPFNMGWIAFLSKEASQKIQLHTASQGGSGTE